MYVKKSQGWEKDIRDRNIRDRQTDNTQNKSENLQEKVILSLVIVPEDSDKRETSFSFHTLLLFECYPFVIFSIKYFHENY